MIDKDDPLLALNCQSIKVHCPNIWTVHNKLIYTIKSLANIIIIITSQINRVVSLQYGGRVRTCTTHIVQLL